MEAREPVSLGGAQETLLLPLWGRAIETRKSQPLLVDPAAIRIADALDYDFTAMAQKVNPVTRLSWIMRSLHIDRATRAFLSVHPEATIVNLGCGLDTTFERVDNGRLTWFDLDLPDVIALRRRFIPDSERRRALAGSLLEDAWRKDVEPRGSVLFLAAGVLYYLREDELRAWLKGMASPFPDAELVFDACSPLGLRLANKRVIAAAGMNAGAFLKWGLKRARDLETWDAPVAVIEHFPMFRGAGRGLTIGESLGAFVSDALAVMSIVRLRFAPPSPQTET
jgi:O-methyltransferase involved in polyketide biosynthesis